jgi:hypothetical protein
VNRLRECAGLSTSSAMATARSLAEIREVAPDIQAINGLAYYARTHLIAGRRDVTASLPVADRKAACAPFRR